MKYEYFLVLAATLLFPLLISFHPRLRIYRTPLRLVVSILGMCVPFWIWDAVVTARGHWAFNPEYVVGWSAFALPIEEILFFVVIGFNAIFTWEALNTLVGNRR